MMYGGGERARTIYISGPVTGQEDTAFERFNEAASALLLHADFSGRALPCACIPKGISHEEAMRRSLRVLVDHCDAMALLPGWEKSRGCLAEYAVACAIGIPVKPIDQWLEEDRCPATP